MANPEKDKKILGLIAGPTASGKTALALEVAKHRPITIINADSAQVYADLPILSAQPSVAEQASCPHRLFGYLDGSETCSAARWAQDAKAEIAAAWEAGRLPVLVGGTGLYIQTLLEGIAPIPQIDDAIRDQVRAMEVAELHPALAALDPLMGSKLNANDKTRLQRALEVIRATGRSIADWRADKVGGIGDMLQLSPLLLLPPRDWLYERCNRRFEMMMQAGARDEVETLLSRGLTDDCPVMRAIGVPEVAGLIRGQMSEDEAIASASQATRNYAKRQYTWFRGQSPADWQRHEGAINSNFIDNFVTLFQ